MIRDEKQRGHLEALGAEIIIGDLLEDFSFAYNNMDAVIFTAGSGGKGGPELTKKSIKKPLLKPPPLPKKKAYNALYLSALSTPVKVIKCLKRSLTTWKQKVLLIKLFLQVI